MLITISYCDFLRAPHCEPRIAKLGLRYKRYCHSVMHPLSKTIYCAYNLTHEWHGNRRILRCDNANLIGRVYDEPLFSKKKPTVPDIVG